MLLTEKAVDQYYEESLDKWYGIKIIKIGDLGKQFALNIERNLQSKVSYKINSMNNLWKCSPKEDLFMNPNGGITRLTTLLYDTDEEFKKLYSKLCSDLLMTFGGNKVIQRQPTIRVYASSSPNDFCPYWHSDLLVGHPVGTLNMWIPFTEPDQNQFHGFNICDSEISKNFYLKMRKIYSPYKFLENKNIIKSKMLMDNSISVKASVGEAVVFDSRCFHSAVPIKKHSRVSMDIRVIEMEYLQSPYPTFRGLGRRKAKFDLENYYIKK